MRGKFFKIVLLPQLKWQFFIIKNFATFLQKKIFVFI